MRSGITNKALLSMLVLAAFNLNAAQSRDSDSWWFEIEAIIFERNISPDAIEEHFPLDVTHIATEDLPDFISDALVPNFDFIRQGAKTCLAPDVPPALPPQTTQLPEIFDIYSESGVTKLLEKHRTAASEELLSQSLLRQPEWVIQNTPSKTLEAQLQGFLSNPDSDFSSWIAHQSNPVFVPVEDTKTSEIELTRVPETLYCQWPAEQALLVTEETNRLRNHVFLANTPTVIDGLEKPYADTAYALPASMLQLRTLRRDIDRTRGLNVMLHTAWRQNVIVGRDEAPWYRIFAGKNYSKEYSYAGLPRAEINNESEFQSANIFEQIREILNEAPGDDSQTTLIPDKLLELQASPLNNDTTATWALDGRIKIFIEYLGRTPYLHLDSDLNYRVPVYVDWHKESLPLETLMDSGQQEPLNVIQPDANFLKAFHFDQLRRMISTELHYFDHPLFGMVVQIRRYQRPAPPETE